MGLFHWRRLVGPGLPQDFLLPRTNPHVGALRHSPAAFPGDQGSETGAETGAETRALLLGDDRDIFLSQPQVSGRVRLHRRLNREVVLVRQQSTLESAPRCSTPSSGERRCLICLLGLRSEDQPLYRMEDCGHELHERCLARQRALHHGMRECPLCLLGREPGGVGRDLTCSVEERYPEGADLQGSSEGCGSSLSALTGSVEAFYYFGP